MPVPPAFAREVHVSHHADDDQLTAAGRERAGRQRANDIIVCFVAWYRDVRSTYGRLPSEAQASSIAQSCAADQKDGFLKRSKP